MLAPRPRSPHPGAGAKTLLLTHAIDTLGQMSCNPAIGGIGKSHLVREIDALGGAMAGATDRAGIQFRVLNARKGPAVRATRAQADRVLYRNAIRQTLQQQKHLNIFQDAVEDITLEGERVTGVVTRNKLVFRASTVVLTAGTFLNGRLHVGLENTSGGRAGDAASITLADRLRELCPRVGRLKTGTPPRIDATTVDFSVMVEQWGDTPRPVMSLYGSENTHPEQRCCWITATNENTHDIIRAGLDRSPLFGGVIEGTGPRYCPSIEDKIHRLPIKTRIKYLLSQRGFARPNFIQMVFQQAYRSMCSCLWLGQFADLKIVTSRGQVTRSSTIILIPEICNTHWKQKQFQDCFLPVRLMARRVMRRQQLKGCSPV